MSMSMFLNFILLLQTRKSVQGERSTNFSYQPVIQCAYLESRSMDNQVDEVKDHSSESLSMVAGGIEKRSSGDQNK